MAGPVTAEDGSAQPTSPFFIMGCRRSGTTLVSRILDSHSRLATYHETFFYPIFRAELRFYGDLHRESNLEYFIADVREIIRLQGHEPPDAETLEQASTDRSFAGVLAGIFALYAAGRGKVRGGDKTPEHYLHLEELLEEFPSSPVVFVVRDPRDAALSMRKAFGTSVEGAARSWNQAIAAFTRASRPVHLVLYEELVRDPVTVISGICHAMGEEFEEKMLEFFAHLPEGLRNRTGGEKLVKPIDAGSVGAFRTQMTASDIAVIETACAQGMSAMGYALSAPGHAGHITQRTRPATFNAAHHHLDRLRYYGLNRERWRRGTARWKIMLRVRARWLATLGPFRTSR